MVSTHRINKIGTAYAALSVSVHTDTQTQTQTLSFQSELIPCTIPRCSAAHRSASRRPLGTSTANQMIRLDARHMANRNGKPCQVFPVLLMTAWMTFGPIIDEVRLVNPNKPKNCITAAGQRGRGGSQLEDPTHHKVEPRWGQLGHHRL
jgi:hypothetical protein